MTESQQPEKANMLLLSKEMSDKDRSIKTQLLLSSSKPTSEKLSGERVWKNNRFFFKDVRPHLNLDKVNMPENTLFYINQGFLSMVKNGEMS